MAIVYAQTGGGSYLSRAWRCLKSKADSTYWLTNYGEQCNMCQWIIPGTVRELMPKDVEEAYDRFFGL